MLPPLISIRHSVPPQTSKRKTLLIQSVTHTHINILHQNIKDYLLCSLLCSFQSRTSLNLKFPISKTAKINDSNPSVMGDIRKLLVNFYYSDEFLDNSVISRHLFVFSCKLSDINEFLLQSDSLTFKSNIYTQCFEQQLQEIWSGK